jgi:hypothetical protein
MLLAKECDDSSRISSDAPGRTDVRMQANERCLRERKE